MRFADMIKLANASLWRNKSRTILTVLAIFIGAFTIMMTTGINTGVNSYIDRQVNSVGAEGYLQVMQDSTAEQMQSMMAGSTNDVKEYKTTSNESGKTESFSDEDIAKIKSVAGIKTAKPYTMVSVDYITSDKAKDGKKYQTRASVLATDTIKLDLATGRSVDLTSDKPEIVIADKYVAPLGFKSNEDAIGKTVKIGATGQLNKKISETEMTIVGVQHTGVVGFGAAWINDKAGDNIKDITMAGLPESYRNQAMAVVAQLKPDYYSANKTQEVKDALSKMGYQAMTLDDSISMIKTFFNAITTVLTIFGVIALVAASIGIINTLFMSVQERTREIGLMKAMGLGRSKIFGMFSLEAISLGFWGGIVGVIFAYIAKAIVNPLAANTFLSGLPGFTLIVFNPLYLIAIVVVVMAIAFLAGTLPARRAAGKDPIEALRYE